MDEMHKIKFRIPPGVIVIMSGARAGNKIALAKIKAEFSAYKDLGLIANSQNNSYSELEDTLSKVEFNFTSAKEAAEKLMYAFLEKHDIPEPENKKPEKFFTRDVVPNRKRRFKR